MGSIFNLCYIQNCAIMNHFIERFLSYHHNQIFINVQVCVDVNCSLLLQNVLVLVLVLSPEMLHQYLIYVNVFRLVWDVANIV